MADASHAMSAVQWLEILGLGGALGAMGQIMRVVVGVKKLNDVATATDSPISSQISGARLVVSLMIGAIAGALAAIVTIGDPSQTQLQQVLTLVAAGYAGADFIEGFMRRENLPVPGGLLAPAKDGAVG